MTEILRVYREIYDPGVNYCVICLRSEHERRMVDIKSLELFIKSVHLPFSYCSDFQRLCWVCERRAAAAHKFRLSVNLSASVHSLFVLMRQNVNTYNETAKQLKGSKLRRGAVRSAAEWECRLEAVRSRSSIRCTDVLVVDSLPLAEYAPGQDQLCSAPSSPAAAEEYLLPDEAPPPSPPRPAPPEPAARANNKRFDPAIQMEVVAHVYQHQQQSELNIQSTQTRPYSNAERQRKYREKRKADKMNACSTFSRFSDVQPQREQHGEQPQHDVQINKRQPQSNAERQRKYRKLLSEQQQQQQQQQQMEDINAITVLSNTPHTSRIHQQKLSEPVIAMESVILEDDERDPIEIKQEESTPEEITIVETPLPEPMSTTRQYTHAGPSAIPPALLHSQAGTPNIIPLEKLLDNKDKTSFLLHPIVENNGTITVPSLGAQIINGQLVTMAQSNLVIQTPKLALHNGQNYNLVTEPASVVNYLKSMNVNNLERVSVVSNNMPLHLMETNIQNMNQMSNLHLQPDFLESLNLRGSVLPDLQLEVSPMNRPGRGAPSVADRDIQTLLSGKPYAENNVITRSIVIDEEEARERGADSGKRKRDADKTIEGPPVKQRETDWEDKIPMDVISYMDATDPNSSAILNPVQSLGIITDVHSLTDNNVTTIKSQATTTTTTSNSVCKVSNQHGRILINALGGNHRAAKKISPEYVHVNVFNKPRGKKAAANRKVNDVIDLC